MVWTSFMKGIVFCLQSKQFSLVVFPPSQPGRRNLANRWSYRHTVRSRFTESVHSDHQSQNFGCDPCKFHLKIIYSSLFTNGLRSHLSICILGFHIWSRNMISIYSFFVACLISRQNRVRQFPYLSWNIRPISEQGAVMTLVTPLLTFTIEIGIGWCKLLAPVFSECTSFAAEEVPPKVMLKVPVFFLLNFILYC